MRDIYESQRQCEVLMESSNNARCIRKPATIAMAQGNAAFKGKQRIHSCNDSVTTGCRYSFVMDGIGKAENGDRERKVEVGNKLEVVVLFRTNIYQRDRERKKYVTLYGKGGIYLFGVENLSIMQELILYEYNEFNLE